MAQPDLILTPFGANAPAGNIDVIPESLAPGDPPQKASWQVGFPPVTMIPLAAGGIPPRGQDFNGVLNAISKHTVFQEAGGFYKWSSDVVAKGGYEKDSIVMSDDGLALYQSALNNNTDNFNTNPSSIGVSWKLYSGISAQDQKVDKTTQVIAGTGLTGGGNLGANVVLNVAYGSTAGTAAQGNDPRLSDDREWIAQTVSQAEAEAGTATTRRAWTAQRVRQAIVAWWNGVSTAWSRGFVSSASAAEARTAMGLGTAALLPAASSSLTPTNGQALRVGDLGWGPSGTPVSDAQDIGALSSGQYYETPGSLSAIFPVNSSINTLVMSAGSVGNKALLSVSRGGSPTVRGWLGKYTGASGETEFEEIYHTGNISTASVAHAATAGSATTATTALNALGVGQTWQDVTASRAKNTTYTNTTGRSIVVAVRSGDYTHSSGMFLNVDGKNVNFAARTGISTGGDAWIPPTIVPPGATYMVTSSDLTIHTWLELR